MIDVVVTNPGSGYSGTVTFSFNTPTGGTAATTESSTALTGNGGLTVSGSNTLTLGGANTYLGNTTVNSGTLRVTNTTGSGTGSGAVQINGGASLTGSGSISGPVTLAAGATSPTQGTLTLLPANTLTLGSLTLGGTSGNSSNLVFGLNSNTTNKLAISGTLTIGAGGGTVAINNQGLNPGATYTLATFTDAGSTTNGVPFTTQTGTTVDGLTLTYAPFGSNPSSLTLTTLVGSGPTDALTLMTGTLIAPPSAAYWNGANGTSWNSINGVNGNFTDPTGTTLRRPIPMPPAMFISCQAVRST